MTTTKEDPEISLNTAMHVIFGYKFKEDLSFFIADDFTEGQKLLNEYKTNYPDKYENCIIYEQWSNKMKLKK